MKTSFFEQRPDKRSMMRLLAFLGFCLGGLVALWGMVLLTIVVLRVLNAQGDAGTVGSLILLVGSGLGLAGGGEVMKVVQQRSESRETHITENGSMETVTTNSGGTVDAGGGK